MVKLDRYIGASVFWAILAVLMVILGLALLFNFVDELNDVDAHYGLMDAFSYVLLTAPQSLFEMLPMSALIGCLAGLGALASNSELTIMRAAGVSVGRIVWAVMKPMLVLMVAGLLISEYVAPVTEAMAQSNRAMAQGGGDAQSAKRGLWHREGDEFLHINAVQPDGNLLGVTRYSFGPDHRLLFSSFAKRAIFADDKWQLQGVRTTEFKEDRTEVTTQATAPWNIQLSQKLLSTAVLDPQTLSITGLWDYIHYLSAQGLNNGPYWLAFWTKVLKPVVTMALVLLAISFIFGPLRSVTLGLRIFTGVVVGFVFQIAQDLLGPSSLVFGFSPLLAVLIPTGVCALIGFWMLRRAG
jgi:lipopolysaccharide export system permease protein